MADKIATITDLGIKLNISGLSGTKCPTRTEIENYVTQLGITINSLEGYASNQLVRLSSVNKPVSSITLKFLNNGYPCYYSSGSGETAIPNNYEITLSASSLKNIYLRSNASNAVLYLGDMNISANNYLHKQVIGSSLTKLTFEG